MSGQIFIDDFIKAIPNGVIGITFFILCCFIILVFAFTSNWDTAKRWVISGLLSEYLILILCTTAIYRPILYEYKINLIPFWSYAAVLDGSRRELIWEVLLNVLLYIPIGLLIGFISAPQKWWKPFLFGLFFSSLIESFQFLFKKGLCELDDVFHNVLGCMIGYWCIIAISQIAKKYKDKI